MKSYIFFRKEGWYPINCIDDSDVIEHVKLNPGTTRVEDIDGNVIFQEEPKPVLQ